MALANWMGRPEVLRREFLSSTDKGGTRMTKLQGFSVVMQWLFGGIFAAAAWASGGIATADTIYLPITRVGEWPVPCAQEKLSTCHNRWHPDIKPAATANPGDTVIFEAVTVAQAIDKFLSTRRRQSWRLVRQ